MFFIVFTSKSEKIRLGAVKEPKTDPEKDHEANYSN